MSNLDPRWQVPPTYDPDLDFGGGVLRQRGTPTAPALNLLSFLALEEQLAALGPASLLAWQLAADQDEAVAATVLQLLEDPATDRLWCAHVMQLVADSAQRSGEVAKLAWQAPHAQEADRVSAGLLLVTSVLAVSPDKARQFLPKIEPGLVHATPPQRAAYALIRAALDAEPTLLDDAYRQFAALDHHFGLAQCALVAHQYEQAGARRPALLRGYLEHAIYRYDIGRRESWAARLITYGLLPLLAETLRAPDDELATWLQRAASFATGARSLPELQGVFRLARKLGFEATISTLEASDPPQFVRVSPPLRASSPVIAAPAPAPAAAPIAAAPIAPAPNEAPAPAPASAPKEPAPKEAKASKKRKPKAR